MLFDITHETADLSEYDSTTTDGGDLAVTAGAALIGSYGLAALIDDITSIYGGKGFTAASTFRIRIYHDPNTPQINANGYYAFLNVYQGSSLAYAIYSEKDGAGALIVGAYAIKDNDSWSTIATFAWTDASHYVELSTKAATAPGANNGYAHFYVDGDLKGSVTNLDNDVRGIVDWIDVGAFDISGRSGTWSAYTDEIKANNDGSVIGPATITHQFVIAEAAHAHTADGVTLTQAHALAVNEAAHAHAADGVTLTQAHTLGVDEATHAHTAEAVTLTQAHTLGVDEATHAHTAEAVTLTQAHTLGVDEATHAHAADGVTLGVSGALVIHEATHAHTAEAVTLTQAHTLVVDEATHAHTAGSITIAQLHRLLVGDAYHNHLAAKILLTIAATQGYAVVSDTAVWLAVILDAAISGGAVVTAVANNAAGHDALVGGATSGNAAVYGASVSDG
jgi:hypothetical protein